MEQINLRTCEASDCDRQFKPYSKIQKYCSPRCKEREKKRNLRMDREVKGLCLQCGGKMDNPSSPFLSKEHPKHCSKCQEYFQKNHERRKTNGYFKRFCFSFGINP